MEQERYYFIDGDTVEIDANVLGRDFDDVDDERNKSLIAEANAGDNDEEMAQKFGY